MQDLGEGLGGCRDDAFQYQTQVERGEGRRERGSKVEVDGCARKRSDGGGKFVAVTGTGLRHHTT
jgi:hypothetical protein